VDRGAAGKAECGALRSNIESGSLGVFAESSAAGVSVRLLICLVRFAVCIMQLS
jgi:hypothetical protein